MKILIPVMLAAGIILLIADWNTSHTKMKGTLSRNAYGGGSRTEELEVSEDEGESREKLSIDVSERQYTREEIRQVFDRCIRKLDTCILGKNKSLDRIEQDMELVRELPGYPIDIEWELSRYDVMDVYGGIQEKELPDKGTELSLKAVLTYREDPEEQALYECSCMVYPPKLSKGQAVAAKVKKEIDREDKKSRTEATLKLPEKVGDRKIQYYRSMDIRGPVIILLSFIIGILLAALQKQNQLKDQQKKRRQMMLDYPEIVNKFTLLIGAGMTVRSAWKRVVEDYESQREVWGERAAYEEMRRSCREMNSKITESECYERFGRRCGLQAYLKFGALLSQNLRKGMKGLTGMLKIEAAQAFEERKATARKLGEEAGTKLLLPMFLMLSIVLIIVIVPAFMSLKI